MHIYLGEQARGNRCCELAESETLRNNNSQGKGLKGQGKQNTSQTAQYSPEANEASSAQTTE